MAVSDAWLAASRPEQVPRVSEFDFADQLERAVAADALSRVALADAVRLARRDGRSWTEIGAALGVTRQAAAQRFGRRVLELEQYLAG